MELDALVALVQREAVQLAHEVVVPEGTADLAIGNGQQADLFLHADHVPDRVVLDGGQFGLVDRLVVVELLARFLDGIGTQQAADVVRTVGRLWRARIRS